MQNTNTIYLIRHGENPANVTNEFSYKKIDYSLNAKGIEQARQTALHFRDLNIHSIYTSPLKRARETAEIIAEELRIPVLVMEHFRELNVGDLEGKPTPENWTIHNKVVASWYHGRYETRFPGGENYLQVAARMMAGLKEITTQKAGKKNIVVGHAGLFTAGVWSICSNVQPSSIIHRENCNCSITEIELAASDYQIRGVLKSWAACHHLSGEAAQLITSGHWTKEL